MNRFKIKATYTFLIFILLSALSCQYDNAESIYWDSIGEITYTEEIAPIINHRCSVNGCHVAGSATGDFSDYQQVKQRVENGTFYKMVIELKLMPPATSPQLKETEYHLIERWLAGGAAF